MMMMILYGEVCCLRFVWSTVSLYANWQCATERDQITSRVTPDSRVTETRIADV